MTELGPRRPARVAWRLSLDPARRLRIMWVDLADGPLAILVGGSIARWDDALEIARPMVDSVRFEDSD